MKEEKTANLGKDLDTRTNWRGDPAAHCYNCGGTNTKFVDDTTQECDHCGEYAIMDTEKVTERQTSQGQGYRDTNIVRCSCCKHNTFYLNISLCYWCGARWTQDKQ